MPSPTLVRPADLRREFSRRLSAMYAAEVPLYGELLAVVKQVNHEAVVTRPELGVHEDDVERISAERHGAIRLGRDDELAALARFFAVLGMHPVNTYDLSAAGAKSQPVLSTAFRAIAADELEVSPLRMFCSLLRPDDERFFDDPELRRRVHAALARRDVITPRLRGLLEAAESRGGLDEAEAEAFLAEGVELFGWRGVATDHALYEELRSRGLNIAADICCFPNPHLNHLTPNTLDIDAVQARMQVLLDTEYRHLQAEMKDHIEGPPRRRHPLLLRQTSYKALTEPVRFDGAVAGRHTARFGEIEQRGMALTPRGRRLYDEALAQLEARREQGLTELAGLPDDPDLLRRGGLAYFDYVVTPAGAVAPADGRPADLERLLASGLVQARPIRYEDFLPVSAAGIFASNLRQAGARHPGESPHSQAELEAILGRPVLDSSTLYAAQEARSLLAVDRQLGLDLTATARAELERAAAAVSG
ncbi:MAG: DUF1338 family protein [Candidatus Krumholzibacteriia bacterium]